LVQFVRALLDSLCHLVQGELVAPAQFAAVLFEEAV
jgi:hypothetical protein